LCLIVTPLLMLFSFLFFSIYFLPWYETHRPSPGKMDLSEAQPNGEGGCLMCLISVRAEAIGMMYFSPLVVCD
jgi:hypothetical protein